MKRRNLCQAVSFAALIALSAGTAMAAPLGTEFTYQGEVVDGTVVAAGPVDLRFRLYDSLAAGLRVDSIGGSGLVQLGVALVNGRFTTSLDFGAAVYAGDARYLEIDIRPAGGGAYTTLAPRQLLSATPYARFAPNSQNAVNATNAINAVNATNATNAVNATNATNAATANNALNLGSNPPSFYINASNMNAGTLADARLSANVALLNAVQTFTAAKTFAAAAAFTAAGAPFTVSSTTLVTNLNADLLDGQHGAFYQNAGNLSAGTIPDARLSANVALRNATNAFTALNTFSTASNTSLADGTGAMQVGVSGAQNLGIDNNEVQGRNGAGGPGNLYLNNQGGNVYIGNLGTSLVGIGTSTPERFFHVFGGSAGAVTSNAGSLAVFEDDANAYLSLLTPAANESGILFGTPTNAQEGGIVYGNAGTQNGMQFRTNGNNTRMVIENDGDVGFGTSAPVGDFQITDTDIVDVRFQSLFNQDAQLIIGENFSTPAAVAGGRLFYEGTSADAFFIGTTVSGTHTNSIRIPRGTANVEFLGNIGLGTGVGTNKLAIVGGSDVTLANGTGSIQIGANTATNLGMDSDEIQVRTSAGLGTTLSLNRLGGSVTVGEPTAVEGILDVNASGATVASFNRNTNDGIIVVFQQADTVEGSITVSGNTVSYLSFTGSHLAHTDQAIDRYELVSFTGDNKFYHDLPGHEPIYGVARTARANDPAVLGAYLGVMEPTKPISLDNPHQIMAVGNGDMWVTYTGANIEPGDYLISSDVAGCAMRDDAEKYPVGHVVARAAQRVDWTKVEPDATGARKAKISVLFGNFVRTSAVQLPADQLATLIVTQQRQIEELQRRLEALEGR